MGAAPELPRRIRTFQPRFVEGNRLRRLDSGQAAFDAMLAAIEGAATQVLFEMYWFAADAIGEKFFATLGRAASRGVEVLVIYDSLGSIGTDTREFDELRARGARVIEYNPVRPWQARFRLSELTRRDHRKVLVVDGEVGFTGGINVGVEWMPEGLDGAGWKDECLELRGPAITGFIDAFAAVWREQGGGELKDLRHRALAIGEQSALVIGQSGSHNVREITNTYLFYLCHAKQRIWLTNSYFVPDGRIVRALTAAVDRGVDVRILLPGTSDVEVVRHASRAVWGRLLRHGARIFEWHASILHSKTAIVDGAWATIGTFNLDYVSIRRNLEINVSVRDSAFAAEMERSFLDDVERAREVEPRDMIFRPLGDRLVESLLYRFRFLL